MLKKYLIALGFACSVVLTAFSGTTMATTPDGETPANEGVCDVLQGGTPGLYGLCVAYCEAQDLDSFEKEPPRTKILENYNRKKLDTDQDMPCLQVPCPCWTEAELASISEDGQAFCETGSDSIRITNTTSGHARNSAEAIDTLSRKRCRYIDEQTDPRTIRSFIITDEEATSCKAQIEQVCALLP